MSDQIKVNIAELQEAAKMFAEARALVEEAVNAADKKISPCRSMISIRVGEDVQVWDQLKKDLHQKMEVLSDANREFDGAATDFHTADNTRTGFNM